MADGWAFGRMFLSESARRKALPASLRQYDHHRPHTAISKHPPITRLNGLAGQYSSRERAWQVPTDDSGSRRNWLIQTSTA